MVETVLDCIHQSMILFAAVRSEELKCFLVEDGRAATSASGALHKPSPRFTIRTPKKSAGLVEWWRGRKGWDFEKAHRILGWLTFEKRHSKMLTRIYADNFRCLVNFELKLDRVNLLLGDNGTGKTTVFEVLHRLQQFLSGNVKLTTVFPAKDLTRWQTIGLQRFEMEVKAGEVAYTYSLLVEHDEDRRRSRIRQEKLLLDGRALFEFQEGTAQLFHDDFKPGPQYPFDWTQSGVASLQPRPDNKKLTRFREEVSKFVIAGLCPMLMLAESQRDAEILSRNMENFVSWYRHFSQVHQDTLMTLFQELKQVLPGFSHFSLEKAGEDTRTLKVFFERPGGAGKPISYDFSELSDGQRVLIALYALVIGLKGEGLYLFLDEPDNYVALREIQPWLTAVTDSCGEGIEQAVLVSHHPEIIDYLANSSGRWFERDDNGPARVSDKPKDQGEALRTSESMARGWVS